ncbi:hypothetical protein STEG23_007129 [Scotinomys teguina]
MAPSDTTSLGKEASPPRVTNSISKFTSSNCLDTGLQCRTAVQKSRRSLRNPSLPGADRAVLNEAGQGFRNSIRVGTVSGQVSGQGQIFDLQTVVSCYVGAGI